MVASGGVKMLSSCDELKGGQVMEKTPQIGMFDVEKLMAKLFERGVIELPCTVLNKPRWKDEWMIVLQVPVGSGEPRRILYTSKENVQITSGDPDSDEGATGHLFASVAVEATKRAQGRNEMVLLAGLPGDPYTGNNWIGIP